jgi:hypothetical protein
MSADEKARNALAKALADRAALDREISVVLWPELQKRRLAAIREDRSLEELAFPPHVDEGWRAQQVNSEQVAAHNAEIDRRAGLSAA